MGDLRATLVRQVCAVPEQVAVVVIDMQRDFCSADGVFGRGGVDITANARIVPLVASFVEQMRRHKALIVWVRQLWSERYISPAISVGCSVRRSGGHCVSLVVRAPNSLMAYMSLTATSPSRSTATAHFMVPASISCYVATEFTP